MLLLRQLLARPVSAALLASALGCNGDSVDVPRGPVVSVSPSFITAVPGDTVRYRITDQQGRTLTATTLTPSNAGLRTDATGVVTAVTPGATAFLATVVSDGTSVQVGIPVTVLGFSLTPATITLVDSGVTIVRPVFVGDSAVYKTLLWSSADTNIARVDASGRVLGLRLGGTRITAVSSVDPRLRAEATVAVICTDRVRSLTVSPTPVALGVGASQQLTARLDLGICWPPSVSRNVRFSSSDTNIVTVSPTGLVTARQRAGTAVVTVAGIDAPGVVVQVPVVVVCGCPLRVTIQALTTDDSTVAINPSAVRGPVLTVVNLGAPFNNFRRAELWLGGRLAVALDSATPPTSDVTTLVLRVDTSARDPLTGARLYPLGDATLEFRVTFGPPGDIPQTAQISQRLTLVDP